jgi:hypothetical protein
VLFWLSGRNVALLVVKKKTLTWCLEPACFNTSTWTISSAPLGLCNSIILKHIKSWQETICVQEKSKQREKSNRAKVRNFYMPKKINIMACKRGKLQIFEMAAILHELFIM